VPALARHIEVRGVTTSYHRTGRDRGSLSVRSEEQMFALGRDFVSVARWLPTFSGLAILLTVLAFNLVGARLRDAPRVG
jgi:hypothetical protein